MNRRRSMQILVIVLSACGAALGGCARGSHDDARAEIEKANQAFSEAVSKGDVAAIANLYTKDGAALPPGAPTVIGRAAVQDMWKGALGSGIKGLRLATTETDTQGDTAIEIGTFEATGEGGASIDSGKYLVIWKREDGAWKLHRDIWNRSTAPAATVPDTTTTDPTTPSES
jgi:uncharacterized protein (TIGR02246 family)